jgi:hypothetical protein
MFERNIYDKLMLKLSGPLGQEIRENEKNIEDLITKTQCPT